MNRGDSVPVAIWTTRTPIVTTSPTSPTMAAATADRSALAVEGEYDQPDGSGTVPSSRRSTTASAHPPRVPRRGTAHRLCLRCWRVPKTAAHDGPRIGQTGDTVSVDAVSVLPC